LSFHKDLVQYIETEVKISLRDHELVRNPLLEESIKIGE